MREKMEKSMKMKPGGMAQRRSEQKKMLDQQNIMLQQMQLQHVNQRQQMQHMFQHSCNKVICKTKLCWPLLKSLLKKTKS